MKILLLTAPWSYAEIIERRRRRCTPAKDAALIGIVPPLGLLGISALLQREKHHTDFIDGYFSTEDQILEHIERLKPKMIAMSTCHCLWENTKRMISRIKILYPDIYTVIGGPMDTLDFTTCLDDCPLLDYAIEGEGEYTILELVEHLERGDCVDSISGLIFRDNKGDIRKNTPRPPIENLGDLPFPDRDQIIFDNYTPSLSVLGDKPFANMITGRGCPHKCIFCPIGDRSSHGSVRLRNWDSITDEIEYLVKKHGVRLINFYDDFSTFVLRKNEGEKICRWLIQKKYPLKWTINMMTYEVDEGYLQLMKTAGLWRIQCYAPSAVQKNADRLQYDAEAPDVSDFEKGVKMIHLAGIETVGKFIIGIPGETREEALRTIRWACKLPLDFAVFMPVPVFPGSPFFKEQRDKGMMPDSPLGFNIFNVYYDPEILTRRQIRNLITLAYLRFYLRFGYIVKKIISIRSLADVSRYFIYIKRIFYNSGRYIYYPDIIHH